jgi:hypothetical protein
VEKVSKLRGILANLKRVRDLLFVASLDDLATLLALHAYFAIDKKDVCMCIKIYKNPISQKKIPNRKRINLPSIFLRKTFFLRRTHLCKLS